MHDICITFYDEKINVKHLFILGDKVYIYKMVHKLSDLGFLKIFDESDKLYLSLTSKGDKIGSLIKDIELLLKDDLKIKK